MGGLAFQLKRFFSWSAMTIFSRKRTMMTALSFLLLWSSIGEGSWASDAPVLDKLLSLSFPLVAAQVDEQPSNLDANHVKASGKEEHQPPATAEGSGTSPSVLKKSGAKPAKSGAAKTSQPAVQPAAKSSAHQKKPQESTQDHSTQEATVASPQTLSPARQTDPEGLISQAQELEKAGDLPRALALYEQAASAASAAGKETVLAAIFLGAGRVSAKLGLDDHVRENVKKAVSLNQKLKDEAAKGQNFISAAEILVEHGDWAMALEVLQEAAKYVPATKFAEVSRILDLTALCELRLQRDKDAAKTLNRLAALVKDAKPAELARINLQIGDIAASRADYRQAAEYYRKAEKISRDIRDYTLVSDALFRSAYVSEMSGDAKGFSKYLQEAQKTVSGKERDRTSPYAFLGAGLAARREGDYTAALSSFSRALSLFDASGHALMAARTRLFMAEINDNLSKLTPALELAGKALEDFRANAFQTGEAEALLLIAQVYFRQGFVQKALEYARESASIAKKAGDKDGTVRSYVFLGEIHLASGDIEDGAKVLKDAVDEARNGVSVRTRGLLRLGIARFRLSRENLDGALRDALEARKDFQEAADKKGIADSDHVAGLVYEMKGDRAKALALLQKALELYIAMGDKVGEGRSRAALGIHYKNIGDYDTAQRYFDESVELRKSAADKRGLAASLVNLGNLHRLQSRLPEAQSSLEKALAIYKELGDRKGEADCLTNLGQVETARGLRSVAVERFNTALKMHRELKDVRGIVTDLINIGSLALLGGDANGAGAALEEASKLNKSIRNPRGEIALLSELAMLKRAQNNAKEALARLRQAIEMAKQEGDVRSLPGLNMKLALVLEDLGDYPKAVEILNATLTDMQKAGDKRGQLLALGSIGVIQTKLEDYEHALPNLLEALRIQDELGLKDSAYPDIDYALGEIYEGFGNYDEALDHYQRALAAIQTPGNEALAGRIYDRIGHLYYALEDYSKAREFLEEALRLSAETRNAPMQKSQLIRLGDLSSKSGDLEAALKYQQRALALTRETNDKKLESKVLTRIGILNQLLGKPRQALENYNEAKDIRSEMGDRRGVSENLLQIALVTSTLGDADSAVENLRTALSIAQSSDDRSMLWKAYFIMGRTLEAKKSPGEALESYRKAMTILESMDDESTEESEEDDFLFGGRRALYEAALRVLMGLARKDPGGAYDSQALRIVEKLKAVDFEKALSSINVETFSDLPNELVLKEKSVRFTLRNLASKLETERSKTRPDQTTIKKLVEERKAKEKTFKELKARFAQEYPAYAELRYPRPISVAKLQKDVIDPDEAVLEYVVTRGRTYLFAIDKQRFHTFSIDYAAQEAEKDVETLMRPLLRSETLASWDPSVAFRIYTKVIKPVEYFLVGKKTVTIVPHGVLTSLPFEILVDSKSHASKRFWSAGDPPTYLVEKYTFCYAPSASLLAYVRTRKHDKIPGWNFVGFGDADYTDLNKTGSPNPGAEKLLAALSSSSTSARSHDLKPLPGARKELTEIVKILGGPTQIYVGPQATETLFKKADLGRYGYVHLATHGVLLGGQGRFHQRPAIVFSLYGDKENDGFLQLNEVFGLKLNADMVVLSSCFGQTKVDSSGASSILQLARSFLFAGADALVLSLWQVHDDSTANLFVEMYRNLNDESKAEALRRAKLSLLKNSGTSHPYYWGPFILIGDWHVRLNPAKNRLPSETAKFKGISNWRRLLTF